jgi:hypothetical protein
MLAPSSLDPCVLETVERLIPMRGGLGCVPGVRLAGVHAGIKPRKRDLAVIVFDTPQIGAAVVTTNEIKAAPLLVSAEHLASSAGMRALVCNSGCANACTGDRAASRGLARHRRGERGGGLDRRDRRSAADGSRAARPRTRGRAARSGREGG